ncbi:MAG: DUF423 domain-containing protein [Promethearchaeota archaeon]|jgi:uncharacterized membrane protein YgdD (TMEM256/DUF423 family)
MVKRNLWLILGAVGAALAVSTGAFGAHILEPIVSDSVFITYQKAVRYQMYHSIGLILVSILYSQTLIKALNIAGWCFLLGMITFSGSLYLLVFTGFSWLGAITPIGGVAFVIGWISIAFSGYREKSVKS